MPDMIPAREFEEKVNKREDIKLVLHTPRNTLVEDYTYDRAAADKTSLTDFLETRVKPKIGDAEFSVIHGETYNAAHGRTSMGKLRKSYERD